MVLTQEQINEINRAVGAALGERVEGMTGFGVIVYFGGDQVQLITPFPNRQELYGFALSSAANLAQMAVALHGELYPPPVRSSPISKLN